MRSTRIALIAVVALAILICLASAKYVRSTVESMDDHRVRALEMARAGDNAGAMEQLVQLAGRWEDATPILEVLASHEDLHEVSRELTDAQVCLENGDLDDCFRALMQLGEALKHIDELERLRLSNLC